MTTIYAPQGAEENGVTLTVSPLPHYVTCQLCPWQSWRWKSGQGRGPITQLLAHVAETHQRCPFCGSVMNGTVCPRCDAGALR